MRLCRHPAIFPVLILSCAWAGLGVRPAVAVIPVIDASALAQLVAQMQTMESELLTSEQQLTEAQSTLESMTGSRGMGNLVGGLARNYLPTDWSQLAAALNGTGSAFGTLEREVQALIRQNAVLSDAQLAALTPAQRALIEAGRQNAAALEGLTREALATTSQRFASIQQLIEAISTATDQKGILELQARITAETDMLQNETSKLQTLYRTTDAQERARVQQVRESALADVGSLRSLPAMGL